MELLYKYKFTPRFADIDSYKIAHHSKYFCWFEEARFYLLGEILDFTKSDTVTIRSPITKLGAEYKRPVLFAEEYVIQTKFVYEYHKPYVKFEYTVMDLSEKNIFCEAYTEHVFINEQDQLYLNLPKYILEKLKSFEEG